MASISITGLGVVGPSGLCAEAHWDSCMSGTNHLRSLSRFDATSYAPQVAGHVDEDLDQDIPTRLRVQTDRVTKMAVVAAEEAFIDARVGDVQKTRTGICTALSAGGFEFGEGELRNLWHRGPSWVTAYQSYAWFYAVNTGQVSIANGCQGPSSVTANEHDGGLVALEMASRSVLEGAETLLTGGFEATLSSWGVTAREHDPNLNHDPDPDTSYRPFHPHTAGYSIGEGGALLVLEDARAAVERGAAPHAMLRDVVSARQTRDETWERFLFRLGTELMSRTGTLPSEIDLVLPDASGVPALDAAEASVWRKMFPSAVFTVPCRGTGRLLAGAITDVVTACLAIAKATAPPTPGPSYPTIDDFPLIWEPVRRDIGAAMVVQIDPRGSASAALLSHPTNS